MMEKVRLGEVCKIQGGYAFKSNQFQKNNIPIIRIGNIKENKVLIDKNICYTKEFLNCHPEFEIKNGDLLIAMSGATVGKVGIYSSKESALLNQRVGKFIITDKIDSRYLYFLLLSPFFEKFILNNAFGCAQPNISNKQIEEFRFYKYSIEKQIEIADKLDKVQEIIDLRKRQIEELDEFIKSQFVKMFENNDCETKKWQDVFNTTTGKLDSNAMIEGGIYPFFTCAKESFRINEYAFDCEALLLAGNNAAGVYDVKHYKGKFNAYQRTYVLTLKNEKWKYELFKLELEEKLDFLKSQSKGSNTRYLTMKILNDLTFKVPDLNSQNKFAEFVKQINKQKFILEKTLKETEELQESLMNKYFS